MKAKLGRLLFGALAFATMCFSAPAIHASAEESEQFAKEMELQKQEEISRDKAEVVFSNFAEFKAIVQSAGTESVWATYSGTEAFVIEESITLPERMDVYVWEADTIIPEGVKLTANTLDNDMFFDKLTIKGSLELNDAFLCIYKTLDIQGKLLHNGYVDFEGEATLSGEENIEYNDDHKTLVWNYYIGNTAELKEAVAAANATKENERRKYDIYFYIEDPNTVGLIDESVTIPTNVRWLDLDVPVTIAKGATLRVNTDLYVYQPLSVEGTLRNNSDIFIEDATSYVGYNGKLSIEKDGVYAGRGWIYLDCAKGVNYTDAISGIDFSDFKINEIDEEDYYCWRLEHKDAYNPFEDVSQDKWYYEYVYSAWWNGLMSGVSTTEDNLVVFSPETLMTRAMFVQVLYGIHGKPEVAYSEKFSDVPDGQWYTSAVLWAAENGITSGISATEFGVDQNITREQMALMLMKYAELIGADVSGRADMDAFVDWESVSSWAKDAMQWAVANGVMSGEAGGKLNPQGIANRAVGATMFNAFFEKFK